MRGESEFVLPRPLTTRIVKRPILQALFWQVTAFLDIGTHNRNFYKSYGVPDERLFRVPYCVDNEWIRGGPGDQRLWRSQIRSAMGIQDEALVFIYTSKHRHPKRPVDAVKAFCELAPRQDLVLLMLGDGSLRAEAEECFRVNGKGHRVHFLGLRPYDDLRRCLAAADVLVFPSIEPWGCAVNEALAAGLAIVSADKVVGAIDMVQPGVNGFIYPAGRVDDLAGCLRTLASDPGLVHKMKAASARLADTFTYEIAAQGLVEAAYFAVGRRPVPAAPPNRPMLA